MADLSPGSRRSIGSPRSPRPPSEQAQPGSRLPAAERRQQLLAVAIEVFGTLGYHDTSMADLAGKAGVTKPVLYQHFSSKRDLYRAVVAEAGERMRATIARATESASTPHEQVAAGFSAFVTFMADEPDAYRTLFSDVSRSDDEFVAAVHRVEEAIVDQIAPLITTASLSPTERRLLAHALVGLAEGASRHWSAEGEPIPPAELGRLLTELAWAGLRSRR